MTDFSKLRLFAPRRATATVAGLAALLTLSGCFSLGGRVPDSLLTLRAQSAPAANAERRGAVSTALTVLVPTVPQHLRTARIPVQATPTTIAYVRDAQWVEPPARMFQRLLAETVAARTNRLVLDPGQQVTGTGEVLSGELIEFGVDAARNEVLVTYQAIRLSGNGDHVAQRRFEAREAIAVVEGLPVAEALNRAANRLAGEVAAWVGN